MSKRLIIGMVAVMLVVSSLAIWLAYRQDKEDTLIPRVLMRNSGCYGDLYVSLGISEDDPDWVYVPQGIEKFQEDTVEQITRLQLGERSLELVYDHSRKEPLHGGVIRHYQVKGNAEDTVELTKDGTLYSVEFFGIQLELPDKASVDTVKEVVGQELADIIDFSRFAQMDVDISPDGTRYHIELKNEYQGYLADQAWVDIRTDDPSVDVWVQWAPENAESICNGVDERKAERLIEEKLKAVCIESGWLEYSRIDTQEEKSVVAYDGEVYLSYHGTFFGVEHETGQERFFCVYVMISADAVSKA